MSMKKLTQGVPFVVDCRKCDAHYTAMMPDKSRFIETNDGTRIFCKHCGSTNHCEKGEA